MHFKNSMFRWRQQCLGEDPEAFLKKSDARGKGVIKLTVHQHRRSPRVTKTVIKGHCREHLIRVSYLLLYGTAYGSTRNPVWLFPEKFESELTLPRCAESALKSVLGDLSHTYFLGPYEGTTSGQLFSQEPHVQEQKQGFLASSTSQDSGDVSEGELTRSKQEGDSNCPTKVAFVETEKDSLSSETPKKNEPSESNVSQEKTMSKPDKVLPCPRCNSMETKFCYYNNYNVGQPRHFCKKCQRYWTAGGTMRNVPVGSGRRKTKNASVANYCHIMVSDALQSGMQFPSLKQNGILVFGSDRPFTETVVSTLNPAERSQNCGGSEFLGQSSASSSTTSNSTVKGGDADIQESCFPQMSWPSPLNAPQWIQNSPAAFVPPCFPVTFYPAPPYFGCTLPSSWNMPVVSPPPSSGYSGISTRPNTTTLGKHSRDGTVLKQSNSETEEFSAKKTSDTRMLIPKTLRIDDPNEAAKSSIWSTIGIKNRKMDSSHGESLFKTFQPKGEGSRNINNSTLVLQANPAALSRSINFRESAPCD